MDDHDQIHLKTKTTLHRISRNRKSQTAGVFKAVTTNLFQECFLPSFTPSLSGGGFTLGQGSNCP